MICLKIIDVKSFMHELLVNETFDGFLLSEIDIITMNKYSISGKLNKEWFTTDDYEQLDEKEYVRWNSIKSTAYNLIKGSRVPSYIKAVMLCPHVFIGKFIEKYGISLRSSDIGNLTINLKFENGELLIITGTSLNIFTMDKTLEKTWDEYIVKYLKAHNISVEEV